MSRDHGFHPLRVERIVRETHDTKSFVFAVPAELHEAFAYEAGQFCTFQIPFGNEELLARKGRYAYLHQLQVSGQGPTVFTTSEESREVR